MNMNVLSHCSSDHAVRLNCVPQILTLISTLDLTYLSNHSEYIKYWTCLVQVTHSPLNLAFLIRHLQQIMHGREIQ